jgi:hypothetical protein
MAPTKTIKERLIDRFIAAREKLGTNWRYHLSKSDSFLGTYEGGVWMNQVSGAPREARRVSVDRIEYVVLAMEKLTGVESQPVA